MDRLVDVFVKTFWQDNHHTPFCPFSNPDTVHIIAYAVIMLNTDLHKASASKSVKKMTKEQFIRNLSGIDEGNDLVYSVVIL